MLPASALAAAPLTPDADAAKADLPSPDHLGLVPALGGGAPDSANCSLGAGTTELTSGVGVTASLENVAEAHCEFSFVPDPDFQLANFVLTLPVSDFDLYVKKGSPPTTTSYDCRPFSGGTTTEVCPMSITDGTTFYAMVRRFSGSGDFTITATNLNTCGLGNLPTTLADSTNVTGSITQEAGGNCVFAFASTANTVRVNMTPASSGDNFNLYLKRGSIPTASTGGFDCSSTLSGASTDTCSLSNVAGDVIYAMVYRPVAGAASANFNIRAEGLSTCSLGDGPITLGEDTNVTGTLTGHQFANCLFRFDAAAGSDLAKYLLFPASSSHNFDLAVRAGAPPRVGGTVASARIADCFSNLTGATTDTCNGNALAGTVYAVVHRPLSGSASSNFNVKAQSVQTCSLGAATTALLNGVPQAGSLANEVGAACQFVFAPSPTEDTVTVSLSGIPSGSNFDLYVRKGSAPTTTAYDCRPLLSGNATETCILANDGSVVYAMVRRSTGSGAFSVVAAASSPCSLGNGNTALVDGQPLTASLSSDAGAACFFQFTNAAPWDMAAFDMTPASGDFDLYVQVGARPTQSSYACRSIATGAGAAEACEAGGEAATFFAMVTRISGSGDFTITARAASSCSLGPGPHALADGVATAASLKAVTGARCYFAFAPSAAADFAQFTMTLTTSDFDLYVRKGELPTTAAYDCRPYSGGTTTEQCNMLIEDAAPWMAMVRRFGGSGAFNLTAVNYVVPTLEPGVPAVGEVGVGQAAFFKVVVPAEAEHLTVAMAGDPAALACAGQTAPLCTPVTTLGGVCGAGAEACAAYTTVRNTVCPAAPEACATVPTTNADLYVRHIGDNRAPRGLPTTTLYTCRSNAAGSVESCTFDSALHAQAGSPVGTPAEIQPGPAEGKYFVMVRGVKGASTFAVTAAFAPVGMPAVPPV